LKGRERSPARTLSQGQRRRVALARLALAARQTLWVLDEPFNALDAAATEWLAGLVRAQRQRGGVIVLTSHQPVPLAEDLTVAL
jgi:heme exporter protein A